MIPEATLQVLERARAEHKKVVLEIEVNGEKLYANGISIFAQKPTRNPLDAHNYCDDQDNFEQLWRDIRSLYIKDVGGGKSALRSDVPGQVVIFEQKIVESNRIGRAEF